MKRPISLWIAVAVLCRWPALALAEPSADASELGVSDARERFHRGVDFYREGSYDAALAEFSKAYELAPNYRLLYNLAQVQSERHDYVAALRLFNEYLQTGGAEIPAERRAEIEKELTSLKSRVATLWIENPVAGAELTIDGVPAGETPLSKPLIVNAGVHQLELRIPGYEAAARRLTIAGNETVRIELPLRSEGGVLAPTRAPLPSPVLARTQATDAAKGASSSAPFWISLASTAVLAGGAVTFGVLANSAQRDLDRQLGELPADRGRVDATRAQIERDAALCDGLAAGALIGAGLSLYFALSGGHGSESSPPDSRTALQVLPAPRGIELRQLF